MATEINAPYPTMADVEAADHRQLAVWWRFLRSANTDEERVIQERYQARFVEMGGMNPKLSKDIGWEI